MTERIRVFFEHLIQNNLNSGLEKVFASLLGLAFLFAIRYFILHITRKKSPKDLVYIRWKKGTQTGFYVFSLLLILFIWVEGFKTFATLIALVSAGLAIAFKEPLLNLGGWMYILARRPFIIGDRIEVGGVVGEVLDIRMFMFTLQEVGGSRIDAEQPTGRIVHIPNGKVFMETLFNYTETLPYVFHELKIGISQESNRKALEEKWLQIMEANPDLWKEAQGMKSDNHYREYYLFPTQTEPMVYTTVTQRGVELVLRFTADPRKIRKATDHIWRETLDFIQSRSDIQITYTPVWVSSAEGNQAL